MVEPCRPRLRGPQLQYCSEWLGMRLSSFHPHTQTGQGQYTQGSHHGTPGIACIHMHMCSGYTHTHKYKHIIHIQRKGGGGGREEEEEERRRQRREVGGEDRFRVSLPLLFKQTLWGLL